MRTLAELQQMCAEYAGWIARTDTAAVLTADGPRELETIR